jgi:site-specific recombinase XerD
MKNEIDTYLQFVYRRSRNSKRTHTTYKDRLQKFVQIVGDDAPLTKDTYIKFLDQTADMNPNTQALCRSAIRGLYKYASDTIDHKIDISFFEQANSSYALPTSKSDLVFNRDGIDKIIQYVNTIRNDLTDLRDRAFVLLLADTGLRVAEACSLRISKVDWNEHKLVVVGKRNKQAVLHVSNRAIEAMQDYLRARGSTTLAMPVFIRHDKRAGDAIKPITPNYIWHYVKRRAKEAGVDPKTVRIHDFRHYFVTVVYHAKGIRLAQKLARHERIETTSRYTHLVEDEGEAYDEIFNHQ